MSSTLDNVSPGEVQDVKISEVTTAPELKMRARLDAVVVRAYGELVKAGTKFPPVLLFKINGKFVLADGHHRLEAYQRNALETISAIVHVGDLAAAFAAGIKANAIHGLRFTNKDKANTVALALNQFVTKSDRDIADLCLVSDRFVNKIRALSPANHSQVRIGRDGKKYKKPSKIQKQLPQSAAKKIQAMLQAVEKELLALCMTEPSLARAYGSSLRLLAKQIDDQLSKITQQTTKNSLPTAPL
jgi:uncharacterized ParB-like nuclease family protein